MLVLGHSLNDRSLVEALKQNVTPSERVAVTVLGVREQPGEIAPDAATISKLLARELPAVAIIPVCLAQNSVSIEQAVTAWHERLTHALSQHPAREVRTSI